MEYKYIILSFIFLTGLYYYVYNPKLLEGYTTKSASLRCPNLLIQKGSKYYLYNSNIAKIPGVNPIEFNNLEEYTEFLDWQRSVGIRCPVLYLQHSYDAQGKRVYRERPNVDDLEGGLPPVVSVPPPLRYTPLIDATRNDPPYNEGSFPAHDQTSFYVGALTPLDAIKTSHEHMLYSDNAMDPNWGGPEYTNALVESGFYRTKNISKT
jgi:hypothetical protein